MVYKYSTGRQPLNKRLTTKVENKGNKVVTDTRAQGDSKTTQINVISSILSILTVYMCSHGKGDLKANR